MLIILSFTLQVNGIASKTEHW